MKQEISVFMDGELFEDEAEDLLDSVRQRSDIHKDWAVYHLIGDVLRQPEHIHRDLSTRIRERMQDEPTVLAPRRHAVRQRMKNFVVSATASLTAVGLVLWMSLQISPEVTPSMVKLQTNLRPVNMQIQPSSNDYLMAHQEFSPSTDISGGATFIRTVSYSHEEPPMKNIAVEK